MAVALTSGNTLLQRRPGGSTYLEFIGNVQHAPGPGRPDRCQKFQGGQSAHLVAWLVHRGKRGKYLTRHRRVVETTDRDIFGNAQVAFQRDPDHAGCHVVVRRKYRRWTLSQAEQPFSSEYARFNREFTGHHQLGVEPQPSFLKTLAIAAQTPTAGAVCRVSDNMRDSTVSQGNQMLDHVPGRTRFVHGDADPGMLLGRNAGVGYIELRKPPEQCG